MRKKTFRSGHPFSEKIILFLAYSLNPGTEPVISRSSYR